jgi:hypothetical protein
VACSPGSRVTDLIDAAVKVLRLYRPDLLSEAAESYEEENSKFD